MEGHPQLVLETSHSESGKKGKRGAEERWEEGACFEEETPLTVLHLPEKSQEGVQSGNKVEQGISASQGWDTATQGYGGY